MNPINKKPSHDPLTFLKKARSHYKTRDINARRTDFKEIYIRKETAELTEQAERCLDCGNPYCEWKCPLHNYIPNWLALVQNEQYDEAATLMHETNPLPEICGRVCPQDRLCEQACTIQTGFGAVTIGEIEKNISDRALANKWRPDLSKITKLNKKVAVIGAGPAGLACAEQLARQGVKSIVYDKYPQIGGLLTFGIPNFKLEKNIITRRREYLEDMGIEFQLNTEVGKDIRIDSLRSDYDALFLGMGCYTSVSGDLPGSSTKGVIKALDFLIGNINEQENYNMSNFPHQNLKGKKVVVLGGGDTAMDCVRSAIRQQAKSVTCVYRRDRDSMPGSPQEIKNAHDEGVKFLYHQQPLAILEMGGQVSGVSLAQTQTAHDNDNHEKQFSIDTKNTSEISADAVIIAFGFKASPADWFDKIGITQNQQGLIKTNQSSDINLPYSQQTNIKNIFAGGDMVRGADLVVTAIAEGRQAALEITEYLTQTE